MLGTIALIAIVVWLAATIQLRKERRRQENHQVFKSDPDREEKVKKLAEALEEIIRDPKAAGINSIKVTITQNKPKT